MEESAQQPAHQPSVQPTGHPANSPPAKKLRTMAGLEYHFLLRELSPLCGEFIGKFYELEEGLFRLRFGGSDLLVQLGVRMHLTKYISAAPSTPTNFCEFVRKRLDGKKLISLSQEGMDRIIYAKFSSPSQECTLVFEMFAQGNLLVLDEAGNILRPYLKEEWKTRRLARGEKYLPPASQKLPFPPSASQLSALFSAPTDEKKYAVVALNSLSIGTAYANEALASCNVAPKTPVHSISQQQAECIAAAFSRMHSSMSPFLYKKNGAIADFSIVPLSSLSDAEKIQCASLSEALDGYYSASPAPKASASFEKKKMQLQERLRMQQGHMHDTLAQAQQCTQAGNTILQNQQLFLSISQQVLTLRSQGKSWDEIAGMLQKKKIGMEKSGSVFYAEL